jgi:glyoxylase-like metal-dependent hydrolase (beta-lactamase superfamily II)
VIIASDHGEVRYLRMARTAFGRALYWTGVYFVDGLLIDTGPPNVRREVARLFAELGVRQCVTTHHHEDHSGNHALLSALGITPLGHASGVARLAAPPPMRDLYRRVTWGSPAPARVAPIGDVLETPAHRFEIIHTPGHADDHVALFEADRGWLFTGDLYLAPRLKVLRDDEDVHAMIVSLRRLVALAPAVVFCQHRGALDDGAELLRRKLEFLVELGGRIAALRERGLGEEEIARALPGDDLMWRLWTGGHFAKRHFVRAFLRPDGREERPEGRSAS